MNFGSKSVALPRRGKLLSTRRGSTLVAICAAAVAGILLVLFLHQYKRTLTDTSQQKAVVAERLIPKGASADVLARDSTSLLPTQVHRNQLKAGAVTSVAAIQGLVATRDIYPGEQITTADFTHSSQPLLTQVQGADRALSVSFDSSHGLIGQAKAGDYVDVMASFATQNGGGTLQPFTRVIMRDVLVLSAPSSAKSGGLTGGSTTNQNVVLRVDSRQMGELAYAADNGKVWLALRPTTGAQDPTISAVTLGRLLAGSTPVKLTGKAGH
jgi:Flp pilus assembly protein CpaB